MTCANDLVIEPDEWPQEFLSGLLARHPRIWRDQAEAEETEQFLRRLLSSLALDLETKHNILKALPLVHLRIAQKVTETMLESQETLLEKCEGHPIQLLRLIHINLQTNFALLDLWKAGLVPKREERVTRQIMARKFLCMPRTAHSMSCEDTFQTLVDAATIYEVCRQPVPFVYGGSTQ